MDNTKAIEKIKKLEAKRKSGKIIKFLKSEDEDVVRAAISALGNVKDEDSVNTVAHLIDHVNPEIRSEAAKCLGKIGTEYCKTYLQHRVASETEENVKAAISEALHTIAANK